MSLYEYFEVVKSWIGTSRHEDNWFNPLSIILNILIVGIISYGACKEILKWLKAKDQDVQERST